MGQTILSIYSQPPSSPTSTLLANSVTSIKKTNLGDDNADIGDDYSVEHTNHFDDLYAPSRAFTKECLSIEHDNTESILSSHSSQQSSNRSSPSPASCCTHCSDGKTNVLYTDSNFYEETESGTTPSLYEYVFVKVCKLYKIHIAVADERKTESLLDITYRRKNTLHDISKKKKILKVN